MPDAIGLSKRSRTWVCVGLGVALMVVAVPFSDAAPDTALRRSAPEGLLIGCPVGAIDLDNPPLLELIKEQFNCITIEAELMPFKMGARRDDFAFAAADKVADWAEAQGFPIFGHMLVWDYRTPQWMFENEQGVPLPREEGLANLRYYIHSVMTRYKGRIRAWNVVNEALSDKGDEYWRPTKGWKSMGDDYVAKAFEYAHEADPDVELYYNDYNLVLPNKREKAVGLLRSLQEQGLRIDAIGMQGHWMIGFPDLIEIDRSVEAFAAEGVKVLITELDVDVLPRTVEGANMESVEEGPNPYPDSLPPEMERRLAERYRELFATLLQHPEIEGITFWGSVDDRSWLNDFPVLGRTNYPLLFGRGLVKKPAYYAAIRALEEAKRSRDEVGPLRHPENP